MMGLVMKVFKIFLFFLFTSHLSFSCDNQKKLLELSDDGKTQKFNNKLVEAAFWDSTSMLSDLLDNSKNTSKITEKGIGIALIEAVWDESTNVLPILLKHPLCSLDYVSTAYYITSNYFHEPTVTGNMLKIRLIELGGKDPDELSDDDVSVC